MFIQCQLVIILSVPWSKKIIRGSRLIKNALLTAVFTWVRAQSGFLGVGFRVRIRGYTRRPRVSMREDERIRGVMYIATTWICTKSFWFLRPVDELLSFSSSSES